MSVSIISEAAITDNTEAIEFPPGDLWSDEPPVESDLHRKQIELLIRLLEWAWRERQDFYVSGNLTIYYSPKQLKSTDFRGPDFFVVLGTEKKDRKSWVVWQEEGKYPNVIIELLSDSTAGVDRGLKKQIYQDVFRTLDYFWFDPARLELQGFHLIDGQYQEIVADARGWMWSQQLELYLGVDQNKLRFFTAEGELVLLPEEEMEKKAEQESQRADRAEQELEKLKAQLRDRGITPET